MKSKILHNGEWVRVANFRNKYFRAAAPCTICRYLTAGTVWYNFYTHEVRCLKCHPEAPPAACRHAVTP